MWLASSWAAVMRHSWRREAAQALLYVHVLRTPYRHEPYGCLWATEAEFNEMLPRGVEGARSVPSHLGTCACRSLVLNMASPSSKNCLTGSVETTTIAGDLCRVLWIVTERSYTHHQLGHFNLVINRSIIFRFPRHLCEPIWYTANKTSSHTEWQIPTTTTNATNSHNNLVFTSPRKWGPAALCAVLLAATIACPKIVPGLSMLHSMMHPPWLRFWVCVDSLKSSCIHWICKRASPPTGITPDHIPPSLHIFKIRLDGALGVWKLIAPNSEPLAYHRLVVGVQSNRYSTHSAQVPVLIVAFKELCGILFPAASTLGWLVSCTLFCGPLVNISMSASWTAVLFALAQVASEDKQV